MTNPITPEVRAAIERQRAVRDGNVPREYACPEGDDAYWGDLEVVRNAMLSMLPPGMPEPVEMWASEDYGLHTAFHNRGRENIRGLFVPLERVQA